jgi:hypothetical protein
MSACRLSTEIWRLDLPCARSFWGALIPAAFVFLLYIIALPVPTRLSNLVRPINVQFAPFLTLQEAEALDAAAASPLTKVALGEGGGRGAEPEAAVDGQGLFWKPLLLSWIALVETLVWLAIASFTLIQDQADPVFVASPFVCALVWLFATVRPIVRLRPTPPYDLFTLYILYTVIELVSLLAFAYNKHVNDIPLPPSLTVAAHILNLAALFILITTSLSMPLAIPSDRVDKAKIVSL